MPALDYRERESLDERHRLLFVAALLQQHGYPFRYIYQARKGLREAWLQGIKRFRRTMGEFVKDFHDLLTRQATLQAELHAVWEGKLLQYWCLYGRGNDH